MTITMNEDWIIHEYQLQYQEQLGSGGDGEVYRVLLKTEDGRTIEAAAKRFRENKKESELESQKKELDFLRQLRHPNIIQFFYAVLTPLTIIVTEYASKGSLYEYLKRRTRLPKAQMLEWARQVSCAVQYLQEENVVHRDIKSSNIVITADDTLKLCDFGIAKRQCNTEKTNHERGTISWMPPEAFVEKLSSKASDIYSLGIVIWELMSCKIPYQGRESLSVLYAVKVHKLRPEIPAHCPPALKCLLEKCWKENRKKRPGIREVLQTIEGLMEKEQCNVKVDFTDGRKKEIYHLYQKHLAMENKQNALTEVNIPIENGMLDARSLDIDSNFEQVDVNGNMSFITSVRKSYGRCLRFTLAFVIIILAVMGVSAVVWHLLGGANSSDCTLPEIDHASSFGLQCSGKPWQCLQVNCEDGYSWTGGDNIIVCEAGTWNISLSSCKRLDGMKYMKVTTAKSKVMLPGVNSPSDSGASSITGQGSGKATSIDIQSDKNKQDQPSLPVSPVSDVIVTSPQHTESETLTQSLEMETIPGQPGVYRLDLARMQNADESLNATIYRDSNDTSISGRVELCLAGNCTVVHFSPNSTVVVIKFAVSNQPSTTITESNHLPNNSFPVELYYSQNNETKKEVGILPFRHDAHVVFNVLNEGS
ncbi:uncharacterized protein [Amphiura filiformis]|uniref:uncharacterized protein isoform X2 n=1 Tax=Amphiura filiformis TaxID=82378 RepID=UPI003B21D925